MIDNIFNNMSKHPVDEEELFKITVDKLDYANYNCYRLAKTNLSK